MTQSTLHLAILASHPIQYQAPLFRQLAQHYHLTVFFAHTATREDQSNAGFGVPFDWDIDLLAGYDHAFLDNVSRQPGLEHFGGCDTPSIGAKLAAGNFTTLFVMGWHFKSFLQGIWAAKRLGLAVIVRGDSHLQTPRNAAKRVIKRMLYPFALRRFDAALYVGDRSRRYWTHYGYPQERLFFSPHCVDNAWFAERATEEARRRLRLRHNIAPDATVLLFVGKLTLCKRPLDLISAAAALQSTLPMLTVLIAGAGTLAHELSVAAAEQDVQLVQLGFCNQSEMPAAYAAADLLVLPSEGETWGLVANEALACGLPIIVSDACGCAADLAADGSAGRVFPMGNVAALADCISSVLARPPTNAAIARKASDYSLARAAQGIEAALDWISSC